MQTHTYTHKNLGEYVLKMCQINLTYAQFIGLFLGLFHLSSLEKISHLALRLERIIYGLWLVSALEFTQ